MTRSHNNRTAGSGAPMQRRTPASRVATLALLTTLALMFSYIEALIPAPGPPGVKLGIANIVVVICLYRFSAGEAAAVNLLRVALAGLLFTGLFGALYSAAGAVLSLIGMALLKKTNLFSMAGVSMAGGVLHNLGQLIVAAFLVEESAIFYYFPLLLFSGIASGILTGIVATLVARKLPARL